MFKLCRKKKTPQKSNPMNPTIDGINNSRSFQRADPTYTKPDPPLAQAQTRENLSRSGSSTSTANPEQLQVISGKGDLSQRAGGRNRISSTISIGQDKAFNEVRRFLSEKDVATVGIYGMGGVGKTTLMKRVGNEILEPSYKVISIVVSGTLNIDKIQEDLIKELDLPFERDTNRCKRASYISKAIANCSRNVALLFDDVWEVLDLDEIGNLGAITSLKVIFTTRLEDVCSQMQPDREIKIQPLGQDDSWELFAKCVGTKTLHSNNEILDLAKSVAKECRGLPLALVVIGRAMTCQYSREAWEDALYTLQTSPSKFSRSGEKLFSILKFSYDYIQNDVEKKCFLFCCLYPEDWKIDRQELVEFWIGNGILDLDGSYHETCNRGYAVIDRLLAACLLELKDDKLTMHDIVRGMGLWITSESRFFVHDGRLKLTKDQFMSKWKEAHGIFLLQGYELPEQPYCQNLSTLTLNNEVNNMVERSCCILPSSLFQFMDKLRILKLIGHVGFSDKSFDMLCHLVELRHLSLIDARIRKFPTELGNLRKLTVLDVCFEYDITDVSLPLAIGQLTELRRLKIVGSPHATVKLPRECGMLSKLEELSIELFVDDFKNPIPEGVFKGMGELKRLVLKVRSVRNLPSDLWTLTKLGHLRIESWRQDEQFLNGKVDRSKEEDIGLSIAGLKRLSKSLRVVVMEWWPILTWRDLGSALEAMSELSELKVSASPLDEIVITSSFSMLKKLQIDRCPQLEKLQVGGYGVNGLSSLTIKSCHSLKYIIGLGHLQRLKYLTIESCSKLEGELIRPNVEIGSSLIISFPCLETIRLERLPQVTIICGDNVSFPSLSQFHVDECHKLEKFPKGLKDEKRPLQCKIEIGGKKEWREAIKWQSPDFKSYLLPLILTQVNNPHVKD